MEADYSETSVALYIERSPPSILMSWSYRPMWIKIKLKRIFLVIQCSISWSMFRKNLLRHLHWWRHIQLYTILSQEFKILIPKLGLRVLQKHAFGKRDLHLIFKTMFLRHWRIFWFSGLWSRVVCVSVYINIFKNTCESHLLHVVPWICGQEFAERDLRYYSRFQKQRD